MTVTTEDRGRQNMYAVEPRMEADPTIQEQIMNEAYETHNEKAEKSMVALAMGIIAALGAYVTGQIIPLAGEHWI